MIIDGQQDFAQPGSHSVRLDLPECDPPVHAVQPSFELYSEAAVAASESDAVQAAHELI